MLVCFARIHPPTGPPMEIKPQPSYPVNKAPFRIVITKVRYLIKRKYDQIMVFNYIFVQQFFFHFFHPSVDYTFLSFKRVVLSLSLLLLLLFN